MNDLTGHNRGPDMTGTATTTTADLSAWMGETPVIQTEEQAREAKVMLDRGANCVKDLEDERKTKVDPLNSELKRINDYYKGPRDLLQRVVEELKHRVQKFIRSEEVRRAEIAREAAERAKIAEAAARAAEQREHEALVDADSGVLGVNVAAVSADADTAFADYQKAERQAAIAEKETHVRISGGFRRALSQREHEVLVITDPIAFIQDAGLGHELEEAMCKVARAFKKVHDRYPKGVESHKERKV